MSIRKVVIFDSGVGGLSIWNEVRQQLPDVECHYLFDNAYFPYGELDEQTLVERVCHLVPPLVSQLGASAVIIACNTASTAVLTPLRELIQVPVVGVVPAIKPAATLSETKHIALLATPGTVERSYTQQLIQDFAANCSVTLVGSSGLVHMAERYLLNQELDQAQLEAELSPVIGEPRVDTLVLGCTHFPLLKEAVAEVLHPQMKIVDSGRAIARQLMRVLPNVTSCQKALAEHEYYFTQAEQSEEGIEKIFSQQGFKKGQAYQPTLS